MLIQISVIKLNTMYRETSITKTARGSSKLFEVEFYSPINIIKVMLSWSVNLFTLPGQV